MKFIQNKRRIDPRYFLDETANRPDDVTDVTTEGAFKQADISRYEKMGADDPDPEETAEEDKPEEEKPFLQKEGHEDHPGRECDDVHAGQTHQGWLHLELMEDIDSFLEEEEDLSLGQRAKVVGGEAAAAGGMALKAGGIYQAIQALSALADAGSNTFQNVISRMDPAMIDMIKQAGEAVGQSLGVMEEINGTEALPVSPEEEEEEFVIPPPKHTRLS